MVSQQKAWFHQITGKLVALATFVYTFFNLLYNRRQEKRKDQKKIDDVDPREMGLETVSGAHICSIESILTW